MVEAFVPSGYCSKTFWPQDLNKENDDYIPDTTLDHKQPFSVYHLEQPHHIRIKYGHLGASPVCRANASKSMQLLRRVLQPAINHDIVEVFRKYILVFREAAENVCENMSREPFLSPSSVNLNVDTMVAEICQDSLNNAKTLFYTKESAESSKCKMNDTAISSSSKLTDQVSSIPNRMIHGKRRAASPDFPWQKRLKDDEHDVIQRRSLSPVPKKRPKNTAPLMPPRRYGSPHRNTKEIVRKKIENWDPSRLNINTEFVMGTKANRALGLGATRGRIYMKHPDLFKYAGDHDDKKWMVKNNCMAATGGKNTFLMLADDVMHLFETEYKDSPGTMSEELQFFKLPEFVLEKMRQCMMSEKKLRVGQLGSTKKSEFPATPPSYQSPLSDPPMKQTGNRTIRQAAQLAAAAISASSLSPEYGPSVTTMAGAPFLRPSVESNRSDSDSSSGGVMSDNGTAN